MGKTAAKAVIMDIYIGKQTRNLKNWSFLNTKYELVRSPQKLH